MIPVTIFKDKRIALFGLGGSGLVTAAALLAGGATVIAFDDNPARVEEAGGEGIETALLRDADWTAFDALVLSPGVPLTHPQPHWTVDLAKNAGVEVIGDIELFSRQMDAEGRRAPFVAITGTNGKSTTTALIAHILASAGRDVQMGGNIGRAVLDLDPLSANPANQVYVIECSSYQIDLAPSLNPHIGVLLNITPDHLERHGNIENYAAIKERLVASSDLAVVGADDEFAIAIADRIKNSSRPVVTISHRQQLADSLYCFDGTGICDDSGTRRAMIGHVGSLRGQHNGQNAAAAFAVCEALGLSDAEIQKGFDTFPGLAHRMEQIGHVNGILFINDSKATNAEAAAPALSSFPHVYWIAGGLAKDGGIASLEPHFDHIAKAYFIGESAGNFAAQLKDTIPYEISGTLQDAVNHALQDAAGVDNPVVLLSPAAASFDQFQNFEIRGEAFRQHVSSLDGFKAIKGNAS